MKWVLRLLSALAFIAATTLLHHASVLVTVWPYTVPLLALLFGIGYLTSTRAFPRVRLPIGFTIVFGIFHFTIAPQVHRWMRSFSTHAVYSIHQACFAYASNHEGTFPDGKSSNEAFRQLFIAGLVNDEKLFRTLGTKKGVPDGNIGTKEDGFLQALAPGECPYSYVRGLDTNNDRSNAPLLFVTILDSYGEPCLICARCGGTVKAYPLTDGAVLEEHDGKMVDIFSHAYLKETYGILPQDILKPEGSIPDTLALAREQKVNIRLGEVALLAAIWLPFLLIYAIKSRRKTQAPPETPDSEA